MTDEVFDRAYQSGRGQLNRDVGEFAARLGRGIAATFRAIHDVQFAAPWTTDQHRRAGAGCA